MNPVIHIRMRFVYTPANVPEWIHLFNDAAAINGAPDSPDAFHPIRDLQYCIDALFKLYETLALLNEYKVTIRIQVRTKTTTENQDFYDGYELDQTDFADVFLYPLRQASTASDILPAQQVQQLRTMIYDAMAKMIDAVPILVGKELHLLPS